MKRKVAIQGIAGCYHDIAARKYFDKDEVETIPCDTFSDVIQTVKKDPDVIGLMAIENTIAGSLLQNHELIRESNFSIIGEYKFRISHSLVALPGTKLEDIKEVNSHPIALMQCTEFLKTLPGAKVVEKEDTAGSARWISEQHMEGHAAICGKLAAEIYGMEVLAEGIERLIFPQEIDGGIKKEVSVSCSAEKCICSICGTDRRIKSCVHIKNKKYGSKLCFNMLENITDAYEWSFVAVPAQVNAGVTKKYNGDKYIDDDTLKSFREEIQEKDEIISCLYDDLRKDITRLCYINGSEIYSKAFESAAEKMNIQELVSFKQALEKEIKNSAVCRPQLVSDSRNSIDNFKIQ